MTRCIALKCRGYRTIKNRRGAVLVLVAVMSTAIVSLGALAINWSYIELTNTQLRSAADAAAKAAVVTLSQSQSVSTAREAAKEVANGYRVGGLELQLNDADIQFGNGEPNDAGGYTFIEGQEPLNCARVVAQCGPNSATASMPVLFANLMPEDTFELAKDSTAGRYDHDVCIVVDRSGSMAWDLTGVDFSYPDEYNDDSTLQNYFRAPHPTGSRWAKLIEALEIFRDVVEQRDLNAKIGLVSYADNYTFGLFSSTKVTRNQVLTDNSSAFIAAAYEIAEEPLIGDTHIRSGINKGMRTLLRSEGRQTANRTMILLSDGQKTSGGNPVSKASQAVADRITIHTISFGEGADQETMQDIADETGGNYYHAMTAEQLQLAFTQIAEELPAVLIQ